MEGSVGPFKGQAESSLLLLHTYIYIGNYLFNNQRRFQPNTLTLIVGIVSTAVLNFLFLA